MQLGISTPENMDDPSPPLTLEPIHRKSVSFCLPSDHDDSDENDNPVQVPGRLLIHQVPRTVKSAPPLSFRNRRGISPSKSFPAPCPPLENDASQHSGRTAQHPQLKRSLSVPVGLSLANVLTQQRNDVLVSKNVRARRYSSSSMVKQRMMQRSEKEFNRVAAKVTDFCRRVDTKGPTTQALLESSAIDERLLRNPHPVDQLPSEGMITHRGRRYRTSLSLSSSSADNQSDPIGPKSAVAEIRTRDVNSNERSHVKELRTPNGENEQKGDNGHRMGMDTEIDGGETELNERISKWLDDVNNSVVGISINDVDDDDDESSKITVIPIKTADVGIR